jgi:hypothetical protein
MPRLARADKGKSEMNSAMILHSGRHCSLSLLQGADLMGRPKGATVTMFVEPLRLR